MAHNRSTARTRRSSALVPTFLEHLKGVVRGHSYAITPITWRNRQAGDSKLKLQEMGSRYAFVVLMAFLEHHLSRGDYRRGESGANHRWRAGKPGARPTPRDER